MTPLRMANVYHIMCETKTRNARRRCEKSSSFSHLFCQFLLYVSQRLAAAVTTLVAMAFFALWSRLWFPLSLISPVRLFSSFLCVLVLSLVVTTLVGFLRAVVTTLVSGGDPLTYGCFPVRGSFCDD
ncbi:hypothetical protein SESBI_40227 [Sesbania bispinosa]|nr:hypothetical protein SESBI_40227 [Sesbania bispinosa]